jgi:hypothetical protein
MVTILAEVGVRVCALLVTQMEDSVAKGKSSLLCVFVAYINTDMMQRKDFVLYHRSRVAKRDVP